MNGNTLRLFMIKLKQSDIERKERALLKRMNKTDERINEINDRLDTLSVWKKTFENNDKKERESEEK